MKTLFGAVLCLLLVSGCASHKGSSGSGQEVSLSAQGIQYTRYCVSTLGSGDIAYSVTASGNALSFHVTRLNNTSVNAVITMTSSNSLFAFASGILTGQVHLSEGANCSYCGTWTQVTLQSGSGQTSTIDTPVVNNNPSDPNFTNLRNWIDNQI